VQFDVDQPMSNIASAIFTCFVLWCMFIGIGIVIAFPSLTPRTSLFHIMVAFVTLIILLLIVL